MSRKKQLQISPARIKRLAFEYDLMILAEEASGLDLAELLERDEDLAAAWERGQLLRRLYRIGKEVYCPSTAAKALGISQADFSRLITKDREGREVWTEGRSLLGIQIRRGILKSVENGKLSVHKTIKLLSGCFDLTQPSTDPPDDIHHVHPSALAKLLGISRQTLNVWRRENGLQRNPDGITFDLRVVLPWLRRWYQRHSV